MPGVDCKAHDGLSVDDREARIVCADDFIVRKLEDRLRAGRPVNAVVAESNSDIGFDRMLFDAELLFVESVVVAETHDVLALIFADSSVENQHCLIGNVLCRENWIPFIPFQKFRCNHVMLLLLNGFFIILHFRGKSNGFLSVLFETF